MTAIIFGALLLGAFSNFAGSVGVRNWLDLIFLNRSRRIVSLFLSPIGSVTDTTTTTICEFYDDGVEKSKEKEKVQHNLYFMGGKSRK